MYLATLHGRGWRDLSPAALDRTEAFQFLNDTPKLEAAGIVVRMPGSWKAGRPPRPKISASVGHGVLSLLGKDALLDFQVNLTLGEERLTPAEVRALLRGSDGLRWLRGQWVEVDRTRLSQVLERFRAVEAAAAAVGLPFSAAMRLVAGVSVKETARRRMRRRITSGREVSAGPWLAETLADLRSPAGLARVDPGATLHATLRPYQEAGVRWLSSPRAWSLPRR